MTDAAGKQRAVFPVIEGGAARRTARRRHFMTRGTRGTVVGVRPQLVQQHLKVVASVRIESGETREAYMPDREISAILPRSVLLGEARRAPVSLLETIASILSRMTEGRLVRVWEYKDRWFFSFQQWKGVRFLDDAEEKPDTARGAEDVSPDQSQTATPA